MELKEAVLGDVPALVPVGSVDHDSSELLRAALHRWLDSGYNLVFLDLSATVELDESGVSVLVGWVQALKGRGWLGVIAPNPDVHAALERAGLTTHANVRMFETTHQARMITGERQST